MGLALENGENVAARREAHRAFTEFPAGQDFDRSGVVRRTHPGGQQGRGPAERDHVSPRET